MLRTAKTVASLALAAAVTAGCTTTDGTDATQPTPSASPSSSADASEQAEGVSELRSTAEPLPPGDYARSSFSPPVTFTLTEGWRAVQLFDGFFDVQQDVGSPDVIAVQFARPSIVYGAGGQGVEPADAAEAAEALRSNEAFEVFGDSEAQVGGVEGQVIEIENAGDAHATVMVVPPGPLGIDPDRRLWVAFLDTTDGLLAVMVGGSVEEWQAAMDAAEPVLESIDIGS
ncbi:MAG TPA: hypothetical protein VIH33_05990 [Candidatus Limnocylindria bacterium]|jgi:hypothetical protein